MLNFGKSGIMLEHICFRKTLFFLSSNGEEWRQQRRILSKALMSTVSTAQYVPVLDKVQYIFNNFDSESTVSTAQYVPVLDKVHYILNNFDSESTVSTAQYVPILDKVQYRDHTCFFMHYRLPGPEDAV